MNHKKLQPGVDALYNLVLRYETWVIVLLFLISLLPLWVFKYVPSMDGPQHLYNAQVIDQLLKGSELFREFFRINDAVVGYWTGHFVLSLFHLFLPAWLAEKMFLTAYVFALVFSFIYLVRSIYPERHNLLVYLIFPFVFHSYFLMGYYAFSIAAIFFFWAFGYYIRHSNRFRWKEMGLFGILVLGIFLSHALVFLFFALSFVLYFVTVTLSGYLGTQQKVSLKGLFDRLWRLFLSVLPTFLVWILYIRRVMEINQTVTMARDGKMELLKFLVRIRQLVGFHHEMESPAYYVLFGFLFLLSLVVLIQYLRRRIDRKGSWLEVLDHSHAWVFVSLMFLVAYFFAPDRISAGSLTHRFGLFFFLSLLVCLATQPVPRWIQLLALLVAVGVLGTSRTIQSGFLHRLNGDITEIQEMAPYMEDGSTVLSINSSSNWVHRHFQLYVAVDKELVHLRNPQCAGQFPVEWNENTLPECYVGDQWVRPSRAPDVRGLGHRKLQVDYITVFYQKTFWEEQQQDRWKEILQDDYELVMTTSRELGALYRKRQGPR